MGFGNKPFSFPLPHYASHLQPGQILPLMSDPEVNTEILKRQAVCISSAFFAGASVQEMFQASHLHFGACSAKSIPLICPCCPRAPCSYLQKRRQREQGILHSSLPLPAPPPASTAAAAAASDGSPAVPTPAVPPARRSVQGLPPGTNNAFASRVKGDTVRPPASTPLLTLLDDERLARAIVVRVLDAGRPVQLTDRVAGYPVTYGSLGQLMMRSGQAFLLVNGEGRQVCSGGDRRRGSCLQEHAACNVAEPSNMPLARPPACVQTLLITARIHGQRQLPAAPRPPRTRLKTYLPSSHAHPVCRLLRLTCCSTPPPWWARACWREAARTPPALRQRHCSRALRCSSSCSPLCWSARAMPQHQPWQCQRWAVWQRPASWLLHTMPASTWQAAASWSASAQQSARMQPPATPCTTAPAPAAMARAQAWMMTLAQAAAARCLAAG